MLILAINPGSTSTKLGIFRDEEAVCKLTVSHPAQELARFQRIADQEEYRYETILEFLRSQGYAPSDFDCVVARGGGLLGLKSGAYRVNPAMLQTLRGIRLGEHASTLAAGIAYRMMEPLGRPAFIYDAITVDEWEPMVKITGLKQYFRRPYQHTLNARRVAFEVAAELGRSIDDFTIIVAHLGGGITSNLIVNGHMRETMTSSELVFAAERCGGFSFNDMVDIFQDYHCDIPVIRKLNGGKGGLVSHFGTNDLRAVEAMVDQGNEQARLVLEAMAYRIAQGIAAVSVLVNGAVDAIAITGGMAHSQRLTGWIRERVEFLAPVFLKPGELELEALALGGLRVMRGQEEAHEFIAAPVS